MTLEPRNAQDADRRAAAEQVIASADELTALDQAIGDGDHGANMKRGFEAVLASSTRSPPSRSDEALKAIGKTLVMKVGGASGPLYGSFFMAARQALSRSEPTAGRSRRRASAAAIEAVKARGKSDVGQKTMLDVLVPVLEALRAGAGSPDLVERIARGGRRAVERDACRCRRPRAAPRSSASAASAIMDPGARSSCADGARRLRHRWRMRQ